MRKIYIDLGAYDGDTIQMFREGKVVERPDLNEFEIYAFEPLPRFREILRKIQDITFNPAAAWIKDGQMELTLDIGQAATIVKETELFDEYKKINETVLVESIDISQWIRNNFLADDCIILKMDIEGAEYAILDKMIADGTDKYIDNLIIEFHDRLFTDYGDRTVKLREHFINVIKEWY